ncbi:hypothetical protein NW768_008365 [Fusarium equiseti]|uniref:F-box domain-containing protein n=1 Tax=Fusarium equiseti TaxID=61235 RepID=A0ABQ8R6S4_FUSEQ|nr:hypothetical protein NW768_008365 [Fusarium equiseti]
MASKLIQLLSDEGHINLNITDNILGNLGIADIFALHATCRALRWLHGQMTESPYLLHVDTQLGHYFRDPSRFRYELGKCDGVICGGFVQNFLERNSPVNQIMQIVLQEGPKSTQFIEYLLSSEEVGIDDTYAYDDGEVYFLHSTGDPFRDIWVETTPNPPVTEVINGALTTVDLSFMTWNKAYSLLPVATVQKHKFYPLKPFDQVMGERLRLLARVGWTTRDLLWPDETRDYLPSGELHQIGGPKTLIIKLANSPQGEFTPDFVVESGIFSITQDPARTCPGMIIGVEASAPSPALQYQHVGPGRTQESVCWMEFLHSKLNRWMFVEFTKSPFANWPPGFEPGLGPEGFSVPSSYHPPLEESWTFADDQIGPWFAEWKRLHEETELSGHIMPIE